MEKEQKYYIEPTNENGELIDGLNRVILDEKGEPKKGTERPQFDHEKFSSFLNSKEKDENDNTFIAQIVSLSEKQFEGTARIIERTTEGKAKICFYAYKRKDDGTYDQVEIENHPIS